MSVITRSNPPKIRKPPNQTNAEIIESLKLYHIELETQNNNLLEMQAELQISHTKYTDLYNLAPIAYFTCNIEGLVIDVNQSGLDFLGLTKKMVLNRSFSHFVSPEFHLLFSAYRKLAFDKDDSQIREIKVLRRNHSAQDVQLECKAIQSSHSDKKQLLICMTDIAHRKLQDKASHLQRMKISSVDRIQSIQEQIYSLADNQNHSLTVINNYIRGCIRRLDTNRVNTDDIVKILKKTMEQSDILADIISQVKNFTTKNLLRYESADINKIIQDTILLIQYEMIEFPVCIHFKSVEGFPTVKVDILCIQQVLLNLARNAFEAMRDAKIKNPKLSIELNINFENIIEISIIDNGPGFSEETAKNLFEANFTTKKYAVGLGLSVSRMIIEKHSGQLTAISNPGAGSCFRISLPCIAVNA